MASIPDASPAIDNWNGVDLRAYAQYISSDGRVRPFSLFCETVTVCCNTCLICTYHYKKPPARVMSMEVFRRAVEQFDRMGGGCLSLTPAPGEIFLDPHLVDRVSFLARYPAISVSTATNAVPVANYDDNELQTITRGLRRIYFSIYGMDREEYALMAGVDQYDRVVASIRRLIAIADDPTKFAIGFRLLRQPSPEDVARWVREVCGVEIPHGAMCGPYHNWGGDADVATPLPQEATWKAPLKGGVHAPCLWPLIGVRVRHNGDVCMCLAFGNDDDGLVLGNIGETELLDIYNSAQARACLDFRERVPTTCSRCNWHVPLSDVGQYEYYFTDPYSGLGG